MNAIRPTKTHATLLVLSGVVALAVGAALVLAPESFHASNGIELGDDASLMSEVRAPGGALFAFGALMLWGAFARSLTLAATALGAALYLSYGVARLVSIALDGMPAPGLVGALTIEFALGAACAVLFARATNRASLAARAAGEAA